MKDRHAQTERECEWCGRLFMARVERVNKGQGRFCSRSCANAKQKQDGQETWGFEKGKQYWDGERWIVRWIDEDGRPHNTSYSYWWWTLNVEEVPDGYVVTYVDQDYTNISPDNFSLRLLADVSRENASHGNTTSYGFRGHTHTEDSRKLMSSARLGKNLSEEHRANIGMAIKKMWNKGDYDNVKFVDWSKENNPGWRGGIGTEYPDEFNKELKNFICERDAHICQICGDKTGKGGKVGHIHHIDGYKTNNDLDNLILLCIHCHAKIHKSKDTSSPVIMAFRSKLYWNQ